MFKTPFSSSGITEKVVMTMVSEVYTFVQITHCLIVHGQASRWLTGSATWCMSGFLMWLRPGDCNPLAKVH